MKLKQYRFGQTTTRVLFDASWKDLSSLVDKKNCVLITDDHVAQAHQNRFKGWNVIVLKPGEEYKVQQTVDAIIDQLIDFGADRSTTLVGVGGGVVTDLCGYVASIYMRGISFGFVPTSLLAMVDASVGGKNGIDVGVYKNIVGTIRQPSFLLYDSSFLSTLPDEEWKNGFTEIIKHACIRDKKLFTELEGSHWTTYRRKKTVLSDLIRRNVEIKAGIVIKDVTEQGDRKLLNFGHTLGHALENQYELSHGQAVAIGMTAACELSAQLLGFKDSERVIGILDAYGLPTFARYDVRRMLEVMKKDKKKVGDTVHYILLQKIGKGVVHPIKWDELEKILVKM